MKLLDKLAQKLALRWLKSKADKARKEGSEMLKLLDGWKSVIVMLGFIAASVSALVTGQDLGALLTPAFQALGWGAPDDVARAKALSTVVAPMLLAMWAAGGQLLKALKQYRAGAKPTEILSTPGYVKRAQVEAGLVPTGDVAEPVVDPYPEPVKKEEPAKKP